MKEGRAGTWRSIAPKVSVRSCAHLRRAGIWRWAIELQVGMDRETEALTPRQARILARQLEQLASECERVNPPRNGRSAALGNDAPHAGGVPTS